MTSGSDFRIVRGGSWLRSQRSARCAVRSRDDLDDFYLHLGFRVVVSVGSARSDSDLLDFEPRVVRGGSWYYPRWFARCAIRDWYAPDDFNSDLGFRVVVPVGLAGIISQPNSSVLNLGLRVVRGGSWDFNPWLARCAVRRRVVPDHFYTGLGFRVVVSENKTP